MKLFIISFFCSITLFGCAQTSNVKIPLGIKGAPSKGEAVADFSEGCFWHSKFSWRS
jgi:hypothetical protein